MNRQYVYKELQAFANRLSPFLAICRELQLFRGDRATIVECHTRALALLLPDVARILETWLDRLDDLKRDLSYRDRALRAERQLRDIKKRRDGKG